MAKLAQGFHLFGKNKILVRSLVIYHCQFKELQDESELVSIKRTYRELDGSYRHEESNLDYTIFSRGGTFHLHDIFLTDSFGITVAFMDTKGQFEIFDLESDIERNKQLEFLNLEREEVLLLSHVEANPVK